jgi:hypothetical protein
VPALRVANVAVTAAVPHMTAAVRP